MFDFRKWKSQRQEVQEILCKDCGFCPNCSHFKAIKGHIEEILWSGFQKEDAPESMQKIEALDLKSFRIHYTSANLIKYNQSTTTNSDSW